MKTITCPHCGQPVPVNAGRKPLNISVTNINDKLAIYRDIAAVARILGCSRGYIYNTLKANGFMWDRKNKKLLLYKMSEERI
jgi:hypothetical protein